MNTIPKIEPIGNYQFPSVTSSHLSNGTPLHLIPFYHDEMMRIDIWFEAGKIFQSKCFLASMTNSLMKEGTAHHSSKKIDELFDYYGCSFTASISHKYASFKIVLLKKYLDKILGLICEIITEPTFPESEFQLKVLKSKQGYVIKEREVDTLASKGILQCIFGKNGTLAIKSTLEDYDKLTIDDIKQFHRKFYVMNNCQIFLSGNITSEVRKMVDDTLGSIPFEKDYKSPSFLYIEEPRLEKKLYVPKEDSVQSAVFLGRKLYDPQTPETFKVSVLNTVLGGYFGSRLMKNIREDKGYTYGINSGLCRYLDNYLLLIKTETDNRYVKPLLNEIYKEMDRLVNEKITEIELNEVKNYMLGKILRISDGSFSVVDIYISSILREIDLPTYYRQKTEVIQTITSEDIMNMAQKYLYKNDYYEVVAGKYE